MGRLLLRIVLVVVPLELTGSSCAAEEQVTYLIAPGSTYTYKVGGGVPIPGGQPSSTMLDFGLTGVLTILFDDPAGRATIVATDVVVTGNEAIRDRLPRPFGFTIPTDETLLQQYWGPGGFVESGRTSSQVTYIRGSGGFSKPLTIDRFAEGRLTLTGGFDGTPADASALLFNINAVAVPEPSGWLLAGTGLAVVSQARRIRRLKASPK